MSLVTAAKNEALNALDLELISLHSGAPTEAGTANEITGGGYSRQSATFGLASGGSRALTNQPQFDVAAGTTVSHYVVRAANGDVKDVGAFATSETFANAGVYTVDSGTISIT